MTTIEAKEYQKQLEQVIDHVVTCMIQEFRRDNYHFMPERFRRACVPGANVKARS